MSIRTIRNFGEIAVVHKDNKREVLNLKYIPSIGEVGICFDNDSLNAPFHFWLETSSSLETKAILIEEEFDWMREGEAMRVAKAVEEWVKK
ncbi:hypothetical protein [Kosakonia phage 305]|uniref:Uncharacterized protein n=1 Tax=Kosakonia phage 305 TaxID=2863193 RepID=A0AAE7WFS7_9CAUD|nr:hypothetical protein PP421_gp116 [Kosakonia phage 305]QYN80267.1 hypothetical protein [Kosakonia phage 305]